MPVSKLTTRLKRPIVIVLAIAALLVAAFYAGQALAADPTPPVKAHGGHASPHPIARPVGYLRAKQQCPASGTLVECRAALRRALAAVDWQRGENLKLAREMVGKLSDWTCIHRGEGSWTDTRDPYWGGLQMDRAFMRTYGRDMIRRHHGWANTWTPREQVIVAQRAFAQGRGYNPWPTTGRACGLL